MKTIKPAAAVNLLKTIKTGGEFVDVARFLNESASVNDLAEQLKSAGSKLDPNAVMAAKAASGGVLSEAQLATLAGVDRASLAQLSAYVKKLAAVAVPVERAKFKTLLMSNPNYFGTIQGSVLKPVKVMQGDTTFEQMTCVGLDTPYDRLEAILQVKKNSGYGGDMCATGSYEYVRFYVDLFDNGIWHDVGMGSVNVHDITGAKPLCYAVYRDFSPYRKLCTAENIVKVRAILSWGVQPPPNSPNWVPVWGNVVNVEVQIRPRPFIIFSDFLNDLVAQKVKIPDPIGPVIKAINPETKLYVAPPAPLTFEAKKAEYVKAQVPPHRFAFAQVQKMMAAPISLTPEASTVSPLVKLGLTEAEAKAVIDKIIIAPTDGDISFEELKCIGLRPENDMIEGVFTMKKKSGYSGNLCDDGSTEYVAFWIDFNDGNGFTYMGTAVQTVHDLQTMPAAGVQYAVELKKNLKEYLYPCEVGARVVRMRAILSWETPPPANNPNWVPVWGNREDCLIQLRPGEYKGILPLIETVGDVGTDDIDGTSGLANGDMVIANVHVTDSPFGAGLTITGSIGAPPDSFGGGAAPFKYRVMVAPDGTNNWQPLLNDITVKIKERNNGSAIQCDPGEFICDRLLHPALADEGDGLGAGWYEYLEDLTGPLTREIIDDVLGRWFTNAAMEGIWKIKLEAKNSLGVLLPGTQVVKVRIDNTPPQCSLSITGATFNGQPITAVDCGKFPKGTIITGNFSASDPGTVGNTVDFQHFNNASLGVIPALGGNNPIITTNPVVLTYAGGASTMGVSGNWTLDTSQMQPCGYVLRLTAHDRTNVNSQGVNFGNTFDVGFCIEEPPTK